jgi:hypothetical protein
VPDTTEICNQVVRPWYIPGNNSSYIVINFVLCLHKDLVLLSELLGASGLVVFGAVVLFLTKLLASPPHRGLAYGHLIRCQKQRKKASTGARLLNGH